MSDDVAVVRRLPADRRRALILAAARSVILEKGLPATSVREIAVAAGVSSGTVTHHFAGIDEILAAVVRAETERVRNELWADAARRESALEALLALGNGLLSQRRDVRDYWTLWIDFWARAAHDRALARWQSERYKTWRELIRGLVAAGVEAGEFRPLDADAAAVDIVALIDGLGIQAYFELGHVTPAAARRRLEEAIGERLLPAAG
jgi:AcrR family transcriptional regulator